MRAWIVPVIAACLLWNGPAGARSPSAELPALADLRADGIRAGREGKPIILFFSMPGCAFCHVVRQHYLAPLLRDSNVRERPIIREADITSGQSVTGFDGLAASHRTVAKQFNIRAAPTVVFIDGAGQLLAEPIIGGDIAGLYGGYLENAFDEAQRKLAAARQNDNRKGKP